MLSQSYSKRKEKPPIMELEMKKVESKWTQLKFRKLFAIMSQTYTPNNLRVQEKERDSWIYMNYQN